MFWHCLKVKVSRRRGNDKIGGENDRIKMGKNDMSIMKNKPISWHYARRHQLTATTPHHQSCRDFAFAYPVREKFTMYD